MNNLTSLFNKVYIHPLLWMMVGVAIMTARFMEVLTLFVIIFIHEMGHGIMAHFFSWRVKRIAILPFGGVAEVDEHGNRPLKEELLVTVAGPLQHLWMAALVYFLMKSGLLSQDYYDLFMNFNMMVFLFNLLPIWPLDGGKLVHLLVSSYMPFLRAIQFSLISSFVFLLLFHFFTLLTNPLNLNAWIVVCYLYLSLWLERKQKHYVFMRFLMERYYGKKTIFKGLKPIQVDGEEYLYEVLERFQRGSKHPVIIMKDGREIGKLDENEVLHAYFAEKQTDAQVRDIMYSY